MQNRERTHLNTLRVGLILLAEQLDSSMLLLIITGTIEVINVVASSLMMRQSTVLVQSNGHINDLNRIFLGWPGSDLMSHIGVSISKNRKCLWNCYYFECQMYSYCISEMLSD